MPDADFEHIRASMVNDAAVVEIRTRDVQGLKPAQELGAERALVRAQEWARRLLVNFVRIGSLSSTGLGALFNLVSRAKAEGRQVKLCGMELGERLGAKIIVLDNIVEIHQSDGAALLTFAKA